MRRSAVKPLNSAITGAVAAVERRNSVGHGLGTTGSSKSLTISDNAARDWLLRREPEATDAALVLSLISTLGVTVSPTTELRFPIDGGYYRAVVGCEVDSPAPECTQQALTKVEQAMSPATAEQAEGWLVLLQSCTARRADSEATSAVSYSVYAGELRRWPADVAKTVCERMARGIGRPAGTNWFPTLAEIVQECEKLAAPRKSMLAALERRCGVGR